MTPQDVDRNDPRRSSFESACRDFWIAFVRTETGERPDDGTTLAKEGAAWFGVATPEEGIELRQAGIVEPVLCLAGFWEGQEAACLEHRLTPVIYRLDLVEALDHAAREA